MSRFRRSSQSLDSWWRQQVGRWSILFSWSVSRVFEVLRWMSSCDLSQVAGIYAAVSNVSKSRSVAKCSASVLAKSPLERRPLILAQETWISRLNEITAWSGHSCRVPPSSFFLIMCTIPRGVEAVKSGLIWFTLHVENKWIQLAGARGVPQNYSFVHVFTITTPAAKWMHIYDVWQNDGMRPPEMRLLQKFHSGVSAHSHRCLFSHFLPSASLSAAVLLSSLCISPCPHINPSIYSRSLPTLSLSVLLEKQGVGAAHWIHSFVWAGGEKRGREKERERLERKKAPLTDG